VRRCGAGGPGRCRRRHAAAIALTTWAAIAAIPAVAFAAVADDPVRALPRLPVAVVRVIAAPTACEHDLGSGIAATIGRHVVLTGEVVIDQGPAEGLEVLACLANGARHETLIALDARSAVQVKVAFIAALGVIDGVRPDTVAELPARGQPVGIDIEWTIAGVTRSCPASSLIRDRANDDAYPPLPWLWTGSRFAEVSAAVAAAGALPAQAPRTAFMAEENRLFAVNFDGEEDALLASPFPAPLTDVRFEANSAAVPPAGTRVRLVCTRAVLAQRLRLDAVGGLHADDRGPALDDDGLAAWLRAAFAPPPALAALAVAVDPAVPRERDRDARRRLLAAAGKARVWATPCFMQTPTAP